MLHKFDLDLDDQGPAMELVFQETGAASPVLTVGTTYGDVVGWDLRMPTSKAKSPTTIAAAKSAYHLRNGPREGIQTALAVSDDQNWCACGTDTGHLVCWDLRFRLPIVRCTHPSRTRVRQMVMQPGAAASLLVSVKVRDLEK